MFRSFQLRFSPDPRADDLWELGSSPCVSIVSKQVTRHLTKDLIEAIEAGDAEGVLALLLERPQDPTCIVVSFFRSPCSLLQARDCQTWKLCK